jgi:hypothetical protein
MPRPERLRSRNGASDISWALCSHNRGNDMCPSAMHILGLDYNSARMCGLTGLVAADGTADELAGQVRGMCDALVHRGPDDAGEWVDAKRGWRSVSGGWPSSISPLAGTSADGFAVRALRGHAERRDLQLRGAAARAARDRGAAIPIPR